MEAEYIGLKQYELCQGHICFLACLADLARNMGIDISEEIILGLSTGLQFKAETDKNGHIVAESVECVNMVTDKEEICRCLELFGIRLQVMQMTDVIKGIKMIKQKLINGIPVMVSVDIYYMDYHIEYGKKHGNHDIVVFGIDEKKGLVYIADNYIQTIAGTTFKGTISIKHLLDAMKSEMGPEGTWAYIIFLESLGRETVVSTKCIYSKIKENAEKITDNKMRNGDVLKSISQLKGYLSMISHWDKKDILYMELGELSTRIVGYAGPAPTRLLYAHFLEWASEKYSLSIPQSIVEGYIDLSKQWKVAGNLLIKILYVKQWSILQRIIRRLEDIEKQELELAAKCIEFATGFDI